MFTVTSAIYVCVHKSCSPTLNICEQIKLDKHIRHDGMLEDVTKQTILL